MRAAAVETSRRSWVRLDNASNIFVAARTDADPKVFRLSAELDHDVDPELLQLALDTVFDRYPLYRAVLRRGIFWHYLQDSDLRPVVSDDLTYTCAPLYQVDRSDLLFRVIHHGRRIILEIFHALSDGAGALWFLTDLLDEYTRLRFPEEDHPAAEPAAHELSRDAFAEYFYDRRANVKEGAPSPIIGVTPLTAPAAAESPPTLPRAKLQSIHRIKGTRTPDNRTRAVELSMPALDVLALARAEGVSPTAFLTGLFFESIRAASDGLGRTPTLTATVPVNLRQFFPSTSARNFFATVHVVHTYGEGEDDLAAVVRSLESQLRAKATPEALERKVRKLIRFERMAVLRVVPRPIKDVALGLINWGNNRGLSVAMSNLGRVSLPSPADSHVRRMFLQVTAARPQFCALAHGGVLTITFSSPFVETDHIREYVRMLTSRGVEVTLAAPRVTDAELAEVAL